MFNYNYGMVNNLLVQMGHEKHDFYADPAIWKYIITAFYIWKGSGYGMIIYLATIAGIDQQLYEVAKVEGANVFQKIRFITLPLIKPTFILLVLFGLGGILRGQFDLFYNLIGNNALLFSQTDVIDTYVFRSLIGQFNFSISSAVGFYQSFFGLILILIANTFIKKIEPDYALF
jgi:putative aldouronate transport system permease protein